MRVFGGRPRVVWLVIGTLLCAALLHKLIWHATISHHITPDSASASPGQHTSPEASVTPTHKVGLPSTHTDDVPITPPGDQHEVDVHSTRPRENDKLEDNKESSTPSASTTTPTPGTDTSPALVILMCYFRGGSSFLGEILGNYPGSFYHFEPLRPLYHHIYSARPEPNMLAEPTDRSFFHKNGSIITRPALEKALVADAIQAIMTCDMDRLPIEYFLDSFLHQQLPVKKYVSCMSDVNRKYRNCDKLIKKRDCGGMNPMCADEVQKVLACRDNRVSDLQHRLGVTFKGCHDVQWLTDHMDFIRSRQCLDQMNTTVVTSCVPALQEACQKARMRTIKLIRLSSQHLEHIVKLIPRVKIIHLTRDPRGILRSEAKFHGRKGFTPEVWKSRARHLCARMRSDIKEVRRLEKIYPKVFKSVSFEHLASNTENNAKYIYEHVNLDFHPEVTKWIKENTQAAYNTAGLGTKRKNSTEQAYDWIKSLTPEQRDAVQQTKDCQYVMSELCYKQDNVRKARHCPLDPGDSNFI